jgi:GNAT superfamily N-acetyltransferase
MPSAEPSVRVRPAERGDTPLILTLIRELAEYERLAEHVVGTEEQLERHLFGDRPAAEAVIAEIDGEPVGFALYFTTFSTFVARPGIWLEDVFVREEHRRAGVGRALLEHLARLAVERGCGRIEWTALDWNRPAIEFYAGLGARPVAGWTIHRLDRDAIGRLAVTDGGAAPA